MTLDGEDDQSVYRLAHQTFAEHFTGRAVGPVRPAHRAIANGLIACVERRGGWEAANPYVLRRLADHAGRGGVLSDLYERDDDVVDHLLLSELRQATQKAFGSRDVPGPALAVLRHTGTLERLDLVDRSPFRALVARMERPSEAITTPRSQALWWPRWVVTRPVPAHPVLGVHHTGVLTIAAGVLANGEAAVASGDDSYTVRLWDSATGAPLSDPLGRHAGRVWAVAFGVLVDGRVVVASGGEDGRVRLWDTTAGVAVGEVAGHWGSVRAVAMGALTEGRGVVAFGCDDGHVRLWDTATEALVCVKPRGHRFGVQAVAFGALADGTVVLASGGGDGAVRMWEAATGALVSESVGSHQGGVSSVTFGTLGDERVVLASGGQDGTVALWDPAGQSASKRMRGHQGKVSGVAMGELADGRAVVTSGGEDCKMRLWDPAESALLATLPTVSAVHGVAINRCHLAAALEANVAVCDLGPFA